jgi:hypothetical protein
LATDTQAPNSALIYGTGHIPEHCTGHLVISNPETHSELQFHCSLRRHRGTHKATIQVGELEPVQVSWKSQAEAFIPSLRND